MNSKITIFICTIFLSVASFAQVIPNAGFENWHNVGGWFDDPDYWKTNNTSIMAATVVKDLSPNSGALAMKVQTGNLPGHAYAFFTSIPRPDALTLFVKSSIVSVDSVSIIVRSYYGGVVVDSGSWYNSSSIANWTYTTIPMTNNSQFMDSLEIDVKSGSQYNTWVSVDDLDILIADVNAHSIDATYSLFPNPMKESALLSFDNPNQKIFDLKLYNSLGEMVMEIPGITESFVEIEKGNLAKGFYVFELSSSDDVVLQGKLSVE